MNRMLYGVDVAVACSVGAIERAKRCATLRAHCDRHHCLGEPPPLRFDRSMASELPPIVAPIVFQVSLSGTGVWNPFVRVINEKHKIVTVGVAAIVLDIVIDLFCE
jgi:hypothetical protein